MCIGIRRRPSGEEEDSNPKYVLLLPLLDYTVVLLVGFIQKRQKVKRTSTVVVLRSYPLDKTSDPKLL